MPYGYAVLSAITLTQVQAGNHHAGRQASGRCRRVQSCSPVLRRRCWPGACPGLVWQVQAGNRHAGRQTYPVLRAPVLLAICPASTREGARQDSDSEMHCAKGARIRSNSGVIHNHPVLMQMRSKAMQKAKGKAADHENRAEVNSHSSEMHCAKGARIRCNSGPCRATRC